MDRAKLNGQMKSSCYDGSVQKMNELVIVTVAIATMSRLKRKNLVETKAREGNEDLVHRSIIEIRQVST
jgi:hypothetical protein